MQLPKEIDVTEQMVDISQLTEKQTAYYVALATKLKQSYIKNRAGRQIFTLSGPAGSGKSVVSAMLEYLLADEEAFLYMNVGLDAFHYPNEQLATRGLLGTKGRYDTYDTDTLYSKMTAFTAGEAVSFPYYSRTDHNPIDDQLSVTTENVLLLLEGQWLLRKTPDWSRVRELSSYNLSVQGSIEAMRENVINRHLAGGRSASEARHFYTESDLVNTNEITSNSEKSDAEILFYADI